MAYENVLYMTTIVQEMQISIRKYLSPLDKKSFNLFIRSCHMEN